MFTRFCLAEDHLQKRIKFKEDIDVDFDIVPLIVWLNSFTSIYTLFSCSGTKGNDKPYVMFSCSFEMDLFFIFKLFQDWVDSAKKNKVKIEIANFKEVAHKFSIVELKVITIQRYTITFGSKQNLQDFIQYTILKKDKFEEEYKVYLSKFFGGTVQELEHYIRRPST